MGSIHLRLIPERHTSLTDHSVITRVPSLQGRFDREIDTFPLAVESPNHGARCAGSRSYHTGPENGFQFTARAGSCGQKPWGVPTAQGDQGGRCHLGFYFFGGRSAAEGVGEADDRPGRWPGRWCCARHGDIHTKKSVRNRVSPLPVTHRTQPRGRSTLSQVRCGPGNSRSAAWPVLLTAMRSASRH